MPSVVLGRGIIGKWNLCVISSDPPISKQRCQCPIHNRPLKALSDQVRVKYPYLFILTV